MELKRLEGKVAVITGAGRGIGAAIARRFAAEGAWVVLNSLSDSASKTAEEIIASGGKAIAVQGDVSKADDVAKIIDAATATFGRLDILINNAGVIPGGNL